MSVVGRLVLRHSVAIGRVSQRLSSRRRLKIPNQSKRASGPNTTRERHTDAQASRRLSSRRRHEIYDKAKMSLGTPCDTMLATDADRYDAYRRDDDRSRIKRRRASVCHTTRRRQKIPCKAKTVLGTPYDTTLENRRRALRGIQFSTFLFRKLTHSDPTSFTLTQPNTVYPNPT